MFKIFAASLPNIFKDNKDHEEPIEICFHIIRGLEAFGCITIIRGVVVDPVESGESV